MSQSVTPDLTPERKQRIIGLIDVLQNSIPALYHLASQGDSIALDEQIGERILLLGDIREVIDQQWRDNRAKLRSTLNRVRPDINVDELFADLLGPFDESLGSAGGQ